MQNIDSKRANVRFTDHEYLTITRNAVETGKSIPWLLKQTYFQKGLTPPLLDHESRAAVRRELAYIGNNLNQLTKLAHAGILKGIEEKLSSALADLMALKRYFGKDYGE